MDQAERLRDAMQARYDGIKPQAISARVITVTSGKGGVGKTNFAVNLALALRKLGTRVFVIDADFGLANIELIFGVIPQFSLADVFMGNKSIDEIIAFGPMGVPFISGGSGLRELANMSSRQMNYLINNFNYLDKISDIIIIDTGAGISNSVINFVKASSETIIITTPEPTSITDAYALIKTVREEVKNSGTLPEFKLVINRVDSIAEGEEIFNKLQKVSDRFLGVKLNYLGSIPMDQNLIKAVKKQQPVTISFPSSPFSKSVNSICGALLENGGQAAAEHKGIMSFMKRLIGITGR